MLRALVLLLLFPLFGVTAPAPRPRAEKMRPSLVGHWLLVIPGCADSFLQLHANGTCDSWGPSGHHRVGRWKIEKDLLSIDQSLTDDHADDRRVEWQVLLAPGEARTQSDYYSMERR